MIRESESYAQSRDLLFACSARTASRKQSLDFARDAELRMEKKKRGQSRALATRNA